VELLRWDSPVQLNMRTALEPADIAGESLEPGDSVVILQGAANRDPERFHEPEQLDLGRADNAPLSFGWGIHHCLGASLARMEGEEVFNTLLARCRSIDARFTEPEWRTTLTLRGLATLPVEVAT
jgi:cytochrome P450